MSLKSNLEDTLFPFYRKVNVKVKSLSCVRLFATPCTVAHQAPPSMEFSRQEYWSGLPFPSPGDLPNPGIEPRSPPLQSDALTSAYLKLKKILILHFSIKSETLSIDLLLVK